MIFMKWWIVRFEIGGPWFVRRYFTLLDTPQNVPFVQLAGPYKTEKEAVSMYLKGIRK